MGLLTVAAAALASATLFGLAHLAGILPERGMRVASSADPHAVPEPASGLPGPTRDDRPAAAGSASAPATVPAPQATTTAVPPAAAGSAGAADANAPADAQAIAAAESSADPPAAATVDPPPPVAADPAVPWFAVFPGVGEPPAAAAVGFEDFDPRAFLPRVEDFRAWFAEVPGQPLQLQNVRTRGGEAARFEGLMRLRMPWRDNVALRMSLIDRKRLRICLFSGQRGLMLICHERDEEGWSAYAAVREPGQARPARLAWIGSDEGRSRRSGFFRRGTFELRCGGGEATISRGDLVLIRAPLPTLPDEVYLEGQATVMGVAAVRSARFAPLVPDDGLANRLPPADLPWREELPPGASLERDAEGSVTLVADRAERSGWVAAPLDLRGPSEILLEIDGATAGCGVFLDREDGRPREIVRFLRDRRTGQLAVGVRGDEAIEQEFPLLDDVAVPFAQPHCCIRLLFGCGVLRWWIGEDGRSWARGESPGGDQPGGITGVGLHAARGTASARFALRRLAVRPLPGFADLVEPSLLARTPRRVEAGDRDSFDEAAAAIRPEGVEPEAWRTACAVRWIGSGCPKALGQSLLLRLLDEAERNERSPVQRLELLREAWLLVDARGDESWMGELLRRYLDLGIGDTAEPGQRLSATLREASLAFPLDRHQQPLLVSERLVREELLRLVYDQRWEALAASCRRLRYLAQDEVSPLTAWAEFAAWRTAPSRGSASLDPRRHADWGEPLILETDKEAYNVVAELHSMLGSGAFDDAAQLVLSLRGGAGQGLAPAPGDPDLWVSLPVAIQSALVAQPELARAIAERFGDAALLRVRGSLQQGDIADLELAAVQFAGLEAAAEARRWLGDRAMSAGWFDAALGHYAGGLSSAGPGLREQLALRVQLASGLLGRPANSLDTGEMRFGGFRASASEIARIVSQATMSGGPPASESGVMPPPEGLSVQRLARWEGPSGKDPKGEKIPRVRVYHVDWPSRQLDLVLDGDDALAANRFGLVAWNAASGVRRWQSDALDGEPLSSQDWGLIRMRSLVEGGTIFARQLYGGSPQLGAWERTDGRLLWTVQLPGSAAIVSDPLLLGVGLVVLAAVRQEQDTTSLQWVQLDRATGDVLARRELLRLRDVWWTRRCCEVVPAEGGLIAALGGIVLRCDSSGRLLWVRRQTTLPPSVEPSWIRQHYDRPLLDGGMVVVAQPGVRAVERIDAATGRRAWIRVMPGVERLLGRGQDAYFVLEADGITALDAETGRTLWQHAAVEVMAAAASDANWIVYAERGESRPRQRDNWPELAWVDARSGAEAARIRLDDLDPPRGQLGPLVFRGGEILTIYGAEEGAPERELLRLVPTSRTVEETR